MVNYVAVLFGFFLFAVSIMFTKIYVDNTVGVCAYEVLQHEYWELETELSELKFEVGIEDH